MSQSKLESVNDNSNGWIEKIKVEGWKEIENERSVTLNVIRNVLKQNT